jgi:putative transposase
MPFLHAHRRRVPTQDVDRSIVVGMGAKAAMATEEDRLAFAAFPVHGPAFRTGLRSVSGIDLHERPTALFELIGKDRLEPMPALIENAPVQPGLGAHVAPRLFDASAGGSRHVFDAQVFESDRSEPVGDVQRRLVRPVAAGACDARRQSRDAAQRLGPARRATFLSRQSALGSPPTALDPFERAGQRQPFACRKRQRVSDAAINADARANVDRGFVFYLAGEAHMPTKRIERDGYVLDRAAHGARVAELHPSDLRQAGGGPFGVEPFDLDLASLKAKRVVDASPTGRGIARAPGEEVRERFVEIAQRLLLARLRNGGDPIELGAERSQFARLCDVIELAPGLALVMSPPVPALFESEIVDKPAHARELPEQGFLFGGRIELVFETTKDHSAALGLWSAVMPENADIRKGRHVVYALHAHLVFVTKYRKDALSELAIRDLRTIFAKVCKDFDAEMIECNGEDDHVHLLVVYPPKVALSKLVNSLKGVSSRLLREWRPEVRGRYKDGVLWSPSYFVASCGGAPLNIIAEYVKSQRAAPSGRSRVPPRPEGRGFPRGDR